ncbi:chromosomal replication initiator protein DnaA [[Mycobacterium] zoologicum]|uniref:hypothetical protein n=1 Tax=[Mycobacterium] zoologicum TaxID=2872311 RepID=UPI001CDA5D6C|nr:hypothetical protein [Mycolicibacter sp. MYC101]MEB3065180.1 hypothetical protein [Mycolicibacter sp. MYC101]
MTGPKPDPRDIETRPISVAELLAKNGNIGAPPPSGRRRRRRGNADAVTVAELTGEIPIIRDDDAPPEPDAPASGALPVVAAPGFADDDRPPTGPRPVERLVERPAEPRWPKSPQQPARSSGPQQSAYPRPLRRSEQPVPEQAGPVQEDTRAAAEAKEPDPSFASPASGLAEPPGSLGGPSFASPASGLAEPPGSGAEQMRPDPVDTYDLGVDLDIEAIKAIDAGARDADPPVEDSAFIRSYLNPSGVSLDRSIRPLRRAGRGDDLDDEIAGDLDDSVRAEAGDDRDDYGRDEDYDDAPVGPAGVVGGALVVFQSILAVAFGGGLFIAFDQLWRWNSIVALVLTVLVTLGLVTAVQVVRKTPDVVSTLIAVAVGLLVTLGPLALHAG